MRDISMTRRRFFSVGAGSLGAAALLVGAAETAAAADQSQAVKLYVFRGEQGVKGPDGKGHDAVVPSDFAVTAGLPVQLTVINYDEGPHTITQPDLGLNIVINPGKTVGDNVQPVTTTASFTAAKPGVYRWFCAMDCDGGGGKWAMSKGFDGPDQDFFMAGDIVVLPQTTKAPAALPKTGGGAPKFGTPGALGLLPIAGLLTAIAYRFRSGRNSTTEEQQHG